MRSSEGLRKQFDERLSRSPIGYKIKINDAGLVFGVGTGKDQRLSRIVIAYMPPRRRK
jgi:hypothetical protein